MPEDISHVLYFSSPEPEEKFGFKRLTPLCSNKMVQSVKYPDLFLLEVNDVTCIECLKSAVDKYSEISPRYLERLNELQFENDLNGLLNE
jgi:hypothetical protein